MSDALPYDQRPDDDRPLHTDELPATPQRDRNIPARAWIEAPPSLLGLGHDLPGTPEAHYKRRIGPWLLWRAGPARHGRARYWAAPSDRFPRPDEPGRADGAAGGRPGAGNDEGNAGGVFTFELDEDGSGTGVGPSGTAHHRFRTWKEDLRDHP